CKPVPFPHLVLPLAGLVITLSACRFQMLAFLMVGLAGMAFSIHVLGHLYFKDLPTWPKVLMALGAACFFAALFPDLNRTRGNTMRDVEGGGGLWSLRLFGRRRKPVPFRRFAWTVADKVLRLTACRRSPKCI